MTELQVQSILSQISYFVPVRDLVFICKEYLFPELLFYVACRNTTPMGRCEELLHNAIRFALVQAYCFQNKPLQIELKENGAFVFHNLCEVVENRDYIAYGLDIRISDGKSLSLRYHLINGLFYTSTLVDGTIVDGTIMQEYSGFDSFAVYAQWKRAWLNTIGPIDWHDCQTDGHILEKENTLRWVGRNPAVCVLCKQTFALSAWELTAVKPYSGTQFVWHYGVLQRVVTADYYANTNRPGKFDASEFFSVCCAS